MRSSMSMNKAPVTELTKRSAAKVFFENFDFSRKTSTVVFLIVILVAIGAFICG